MNNSAAKVGEIFREAGTAFTKLSEMTLMLQPTDDATPGSKWSEEEVEMLHGCVNRFAVELNKISQHIKNRTMSYLRRLLDMDTGNIYNVSRSPPRQQQHIEQPLQQQQSLLQQQDNPQELQQNHIIHQQDRMPQQLRLQQLISPLNQLPENSFPRVFKSQSQINSTSSQSIITLETETQFDILFPDEKLSKIYNIADLLHFNPAIVPLTPPANIMQDDKNTEPSLEFDDMEDSSSEIRIRAVIPILLEILELDF